MLHMKLLDVMLFHWSKTVEEYKTDDGDVDSKYGFFAEDVLPESIAGHF